MENFLQDIDVETIVNLINKNKIVKLFYVIEFPEITVINIPYIYTTTGKYINFETFFLKDTLTEKLNRIFKPYKIKLIRTDYLIEQYYEFIGIPLNFNIKK